MSDLFYAALKEKYKQYFVNDPLAFAKEAIDWSVFPSLLRDLYHNEIDKVRGSNIPIKTMVKVLYLQSIYNLLDEQATKVIHDRISFMNFLDYPPLRECKDNMVLQGTPVQNRVVQSCLQRDQGPDQSQTNPHQEMNNAGCHFHHLRSGSCETWGATI